MMKSLFQVSLVCILLAVQRILMIFSLFQEVKSKNEFWKPPHQGQAGRTPSNTKNQAAEICKDIVSSCYETSSVRTTSFIKSATLKFFFLEYWANSLGPENSQTNLRLAEHHRTPKTQAAEICEEIVSSCYETSSVRRTSLKKSATLRCCAHSWTKYRIAAKN